MSLSLNCHNLENYSLNFYVVSRLYNATEFCKGKKILMYESEIELESLFQIRVRPMSGYENHAKIEMK